MTKVNKQYTPQDTKSAMNASVLTTTPDTHQGEKEFFHLLVFSFMINTPVILQRYLSDIDSNAMYKKATRDHGLQFYQFSEWIDHELKKLLAKYSIETQFVTFD